MTTQIHSMLTLKLKIELIDEFRFNVKTKIAGYQLLNN